MNKWDAVSIYDVDFDIEDSDGNKHSFTFKPLPWAYYPKAYNVLGDLSNSGIMDITEGLSSEEYAKEFFSKMSEKLITEFSAVCFFMVKNSYPEKDDASIERFVMGNLFALITPMSKLISRQGKDKRKADQALANND